jgi:hypothetical protein
MLGLKSMAFAQAITGSIEMVHIILVGLAKCVHDAQALLPVQCKRLAALHQGIH